MKTRLFLCMLVLSVFGAAASSAERVAVFSGKGGTTTAEFEVQAPWILDWRVNSEYQNAMAIEIHLVDSLTGFHKGLVVETRSARNGVRLFDQSGRYRFRVSATLANWNLKIEELTREEAKLYTPRQ